MAKKAFVYDGTNWVDLASSTTDLSNYYTQAQSDVRYYTQAQADAKYGIIGTSAPFRIAAGSATATGLLGPVNGWYYTNSTTITLPVGRFTVAPIVTATSALSGGLTNVGIDTSPTTSSFSVYVNRNNASANGATVFWQAVQMTSGSASG
jgi:hypothetical protein